MSNNSHLQSLSTDLLGLMLEGLKAAYRELRVSTYDYQTRRDEMLGVLRLRAIDDYAAHLADRSKL